MLFWVLLGAGILSIAAMGWRLRPVAQPDPMPAWAMGAFALAPGERSTTVWRAAVDGAPAWATLTTDGRLAAGTEAGVNLVRLGADALDPAARDAASSTPSGAWLVLVLAPAAGPAATVEIDAAAADSLRAWASRP